MRYNLHTDFILSSTVDVLEDAVTASKAVGSGIETFSLNDYLMQSLFLKMTGFQEQKMKCICWELATFDYEYRYEFSKSPLGECPTYKDKQKIYTQLVLQIKKNGLEFGDLNLNKTVILNSTISDISNTFEDTNLSIWAQQNFNTFKEFCSSVQTGHFANTEKSLFSDPKLQDIYENHLYRQRNRTAHNTSSYQQNLPTLKTLLDPKYDNLNYFIYFFLLVLIDKIFIALYKKYLEILDNGQTT